MVVNVYNVVNKILGVKGNIIKVRFRVGRRVLEAYVPDDKMWGAVKDILLNREYEYLPEFELCNFTGDIIVDVGAHVGLFSIVSSVFARKIIAIEPHPVNFHLLIVNLLVNNIHNVVPLNRALWVNRTRLKLFEGNHTGAHSLIGGSDRFEEVETITLEEIVNSYGSIDLLKIDVEGAEFEIFNHTDVGLLKRIRMMVAEIHLQHGDLSSIVEKLRSAGFRVKVVHPPL